MKRIFKLNVLISFLSGILILQSAGMEQSSSLSGEIDHFLDPDLKSKKQEVIKIVTEIQNEQRAIKIPTNNTHNDLGFSFAPGSNFDLMYLGLIRQTKIDTKKRVSVVDLGCGLGQISTLAVFAGATIDVVDYLETVKLANANIFKKTKMIVGYEKQESKNYYRAFPENIVSKDIAKISWTQTPHKIAFCSNVVHFLTESEIKLFANRIFENLMSDGALFVQADTPSYDKKLIDFYKSRRGKALCPGLGITNKNKKTGALTTISILEYNEDLYTIHPGHMYPGKFMMNGETIIDNENDYHLVKNHFFLPELSAIFTQAGFVLSSSFYMNHIGQMIEDEKLLETGKASKACAIFIKK